MGSFANSLHLKCDDADRVATAIDHLLQKQHWRPTEQNPDEREARLGASGNCRAILVSAPVFGWVSVLDSDLMGELLLAEQLAEQLNAYSLVCLVNHSDSWGYGLARGDGPLDSFGMDEDEPAGRAEWGVTPEVAKQISEANSRMLKLMNDGTMTDIIRKVQQEAIAQAPPEIRRIYELCVKNEATAGEKSHFDNWWSKTSPPLSEQIDRLLDEQIKMPDFDPSQLVKLKKKRKRKPTKAQLAAARERIDNLRPLFVTEVTDDEVQALLDQKTHFAEETLAQFLPLFGIPAFYAYLSYGYQTESSPEELAVHSIRFVHHLKYETDARSL